MAEVGVREIDLDRLSALDFLRGMSTADGIEISGLLAYDLFSQQLASVGPLKNALDAVAASADPKPTLSVRIATTAPIVLSGEQIIDAATITSAEPVLV